jgi:hypothetical protein
MISDLDSPSTRHVPPARGLVVHALDDRFLALAQRLYVAPAAG